MLQEEVKHNNILFICSGRQDELVLLQNCVFIQQFIQSIKNKSDTQNPLLNSDIFYKKNTNLSENKKKEYFTNQDAKKSKINIFILTDTDLLKTILVDDVNIIYERITFENIKKILKKHKINTIVPTYGDKLLDSIFTNEYFSQQQKYNIFYNNIYSCFYNKHFINQIAKTSGFSIYKREKVINNEKYKTFSIIAVNDLFGNQVIIDTISTAKRDGKKLLVSPMVCDNISVDLQKRILCLCKNLSSLLEVYGIIYCISGFVDEKGRIVFQNLQYDFCEEVVFSIQHQKIDIIELMSNIANKKMITYDLCKEFYAYSYNYHDTKQIFYATNISDGFKVIDNTAIQVNNIHMTNKKLCFMFENNFSQTNDTLNKEVKFQSMIDAVRDGFITGNNDNQLKQHYSAFYINENKDTFVNIQTNEDNYCYNENKLTKIVDKYILVIYQPYINYDKQNENNNNDIFFVKTCQQLSFKTDKQIIVLSNIMTPLFGMLNYKHIFITSDINGNTVRNIINHFNIKKVMLKCIQGNTSLIDAIKKSGAYIYGLNYDCPAIYDKDPQVYRSLCEKLGIHYATSLDNNDQLFEFYCISDGKNNFFAKTIAHRQLYGNIETRVLCFPAFFANFSLEEQINEITEKILQSVKIKGLVCISYKYSNGIVSLININTEINSDLFYCRKEIEQNLFFEVLIKSLTGNHNIEMESRRFDVQTQQKDIFYKRYVFQVDKKNTLTLDGHVKKKIFENFLYLSKKKI